MSRFTDGAKLVLGNPLPERFEFALGFGHGRGEERSAKEEEAKKERRKTERKNRRGFGIGRMAVLYEEIYGRKEEKAKLANA